MIVRGLLIVVLLGVQGVVCDHGNNAMSNEIPHVNHGGVKMGVKDIKCDDGIHNLTVDWDGSADAYTCETDMWSPLEQDIQWKQSAVCEPVKPPLHRCLTTPIEYDEVLPTSGKHRPLWPKFGEYRYLPTQRWLHNLEHGCAVFLYHPCAPQSEVDELRRIATRCLRKHIITPYNKLPRDLPFAVVTYGCKLQIPYVNETAVVNFVKDHALQAPEADYPRNGDFSVELITPSLIVSDRMDSELCPLNPAMLPDFEPSTVAPDVVVKGQHARKKHKRMKEIAELEFNEI
ncbi:uncharacterized protein [Antedon mediterranea]|uniref:uncharacterized protein n=1 Tax=Antedon mediterranea TaxID=105859 RepID=UPI003AF9122F